MKYLSKWTRFRHTFFEFFRKKLVRKILASANRVFIASTSQEQSLGLDRSVLASFVPCERMQTHEFLRGKSAPPANDTCGHVSKNLPSGLTQKCGLTGPTANRLQSSHAPLLPWPLSVFVASLSYFPESGVTWWLDSGSRCRRFCH